MALQKTLVLSSGLSGVNAYHRIVEVRVGDRRGVSISTAVHVNADKRAANAQTIGGESFRFAFDPNEVLTASSIMAWAYAKLKTLDDFAGATDV
jgi:hypothetical protein